MTFRTRLLASFAAVVLAPLLFLALWIPREMNRRFTAEYRARVDALARGIRLDLDYRGARIAADLDAIAEGLAANNPVRAAIVYPGHDRGELLDHANRAMSAAGLSMLQIRNDSGRILSSGHFRNEFDRVDPGLPAALRSAPGGSAIVRVRTADGWMHALARTDTVRLGPVRLTLVGGLALDLRDPGELAPGSELDVALRLPDSAYVSPPGVAIDSIFIPYIDATAAEPRASTARVVVSHPTAELDALLRDVRAWTVATVLVALAAALAVALWISARLSHPLTELAGRTERVDLDRLDTRFPGAARDDEIGTLARGLGAMTARLRASAARLREAERQATLGEVARQVNHDIKNGLTPIRNVVRHLAQVAQDAPAELAAIFRERQATLESSVEYLDSLARNYARLTPRLTSAPCDAGAIVTEVVATAGAARRVVIRAEVKPGLPNVLADSAVLRRIMENLVGNAVDALDGEDGAVVVSAHPAGHERDAPMVRISVADTGRGMNERELARAFDDFYTTKPGGTGLGLSVVRRLVADLNGVLRIETEPGKGTTVLVDLPMAAGGRDATAPPYAGRNAAAREPRPVVVPGSRPSPE